MEQSKDEAQSAFVGRILVRFMGTESISYWQKRGYRLGPTPSPSRPAKLPNDILRHE
jgi:hypothetical protein